MGSRAVYAWFIGRVMTCLDCFVTVPIHVVGVVVDMTAYPFNNWQIFDNSVWLALLLRFGCDHDLRVSSSYRCYATGVCGNSLEEDALNNCTQIYSLSV